jgi:hypothetical protein
MGRKLYLPLIIVFTAIFSSAVAQTGEIRGRVIEKGGTEGVPFASVAAMQSGAQVIATTTDIDGNYVLKPLSPGKYDVKVSYVGYTPSGLNSVLVTVDKISFANVELAKGIELKEVVIPEYKVPLIETGSPTVQKTMTYEDIQTLPQRDVTSVASAAAGVGQEDAGKDLNIRGSRSDATGYYVDGIKMRGNARNGTSNRSAEQITVITGGLPAKYGDATGGIVVTTTREPAPQYTGAIEASTSKYLDPYNNNTLSFDLSGPVYRKKDAEGKKVGQPTVGFFIAADANYDEDPSPSAVGAYALSDEKLRDLEQHPLIQDPNSGVFYNRAIHFTLDSLEKIKARKEVAAKGLTVNGKLVFHPLKNFDLTLGGAYDYSQSRDFIRFYSLMNPSNHGYITENNWHAYAKISQRFAADAEAGKTASAIKRGFYSIQADFTRNYKKNQNEQHKDKIWEYGYLGRFTSYKAPVYSINDSVSNPHTYTLADGSTITGSYPVLAGYLDTLYTFSPSGLNPNPEAYTNEYYELTANSPRDTVLVEWDGTPVTASHYQDSYNDIRQNGAWTNGDNRTRTSALAYGIWATPGRIRTQNEKTENNQFSVKAQGEADIKQHSIAIGLEYEQRNDRYYNVLPTGLWQYARQMGNNNISNFNTDTAYVLVQPGAYVIQGAANTAPQAGNDTVIFYNWKYVPTENIVHEDAPGFYENVRKRLGVPMNQWVDMDHLTPDFYRNSLELFTPDQLLSPDPTTFGGSGMVSYYGYDYLGNKVTGKPSLSSYFNEKDANNNFTRVWGTFQPIYVAGYIQDAFDLNDIKFNIGLRVDRFDANQPALTDKYLLYPAHTAGDGAVRDLAASRNIVIPGNIGDDYVVYVNDYANPSKILGYRHDDDWYDANGNATTDVQHVIADLSNGTVQPYLIHPADVRSNASYDSTSVMDLTSYGEGTDKTFKDYEPQTTFMPRIAFSFPISDEANFKAHYDVLTQRPDDNVRFHPQDYLYMHQGLIVGRLNNSNLKPEKTVDYEIEFQQRLTRSSAFSISAFYKEMRDMIQSSNVRYAYPIDYTSYGNYDFGNAKGLSLNYDLRRTGNVRLDANYTLQFANGTNNYEFGGTNVNALLAQYGYANFVEPIELGFDERHRIVITIDYRYQSGKDYNGPVWFGKQFFSNAGISLQGRATSGRPYTRLAGYSHQTIVGAVNGSRKPWQLRLDAKVDKSFAIKTGTKASGEKKKPLDLNVYLQVTNLLDTRNVIGVYAVTGSAEDDGYIASPENQSQVATQLDAQAYADLYYAYYNFESTHYSLPRRIRLGAVISF